MLVSCNSTVRDKKDTLVVAIAAAPADLDPRRATDAISARLVQLMFQAFVHFTPDLKIEGDAAESWTYKKNEYTFKLKPNLRFVDGSPVTLEDILFSFDEYRKPTSPFKTSFAVIDKVEGEQTPSGLVVKIKLKNFSATFLVDLTAAKILKASYVNELKQEFGRKPLGSGPYKFKRWEVNDIELERRDDIPEAERGKMKFLLFKIVRDDNTRYLKVRKGEVDLVQSDLPPNKIAEFQNSDRYKTDKKAAIAMAYMLVNHQDELLKHLEVRQAINLALNRDEIIKYKLEGLGVPATSLLVPQDPFFYASLKNPETNIEKARKLIESLHLDKKTLVLKCSNTQAAVENARVIANQIARIGLDVSVQSYEWGTYYDDIKKGNFQIATMKWINVTDPDIYRLTFHSREFPPGGRNRGRYKNPTIDLLTDEGITIEDVNKRKALYQKVQKIIFDDLAIIPLWYDLQVAVMQNNIEGYSLPVTGDYSTLRQTQKK